MYDEEIEKAVIFFMIFENKDFDVTENDFVNRRNRLIINAINKLKQENEEISMVSVANRIKGERVDILEYMSNLVNYIYGLSADYAYNKLIKYSKKRQVYENLKKIENEIIEIDDIDNLIEMQINNLNKIQSRNQVMLDFPQQVLLSIEEIEKNYKNQSDYSLYTGILNLDKLLLGLHRQELTVIGARPGMGKTTFALQIAENIAQKNVDVLFISLEMADTQIIQKMIARKSNINSHKLRSGKLEENDFLKISQCCSDISELPFHLITKVRTIQEIEVIARQYKNRNELGLMVIDYIQLLKNKNKFQSREQEVADISRTLKLLSLELDIPIIGLCQLNRNATRTEPSLADLRESGAIEQDADNVIFLYPEEGQEEEKAPLVVAKVAKQRAGDIGKAMLKFKKVNSNFISIVKD